VFLVCISKSTVTQGGAFFTAFVITEALKLRCYFCCSIPKAKKSRVLYAFDFEKHANNSIRYESTPCLSWRYLTDEYTASGVNTKLLL